ncbi:MAG: c-type cytochrome [Bryobacteraceae bacterium]
MWTLSALLAALLAQSPKYGVGRAPSAAEIESLGASAMPDGTGLPPGSGTAAKGREVYERRCAKCHGGKAEGGDDAALVGGAGSLKTPKPLKTVTSFWPHATTVWDYVNRSMPFNQPGTLTPDQVYAVTAYILHLGGIVGESDVLDAKTLPKVNMPNRNGFTSDPRPDTGGKKRK